MAIGRDDRPDRRDVADPGRARRAPASDCRRGHAGDGLGRPHDPGDGRQVSPRVDRYRPGRHRRAGRASAWVLAEEADRFVITTSAMRVAVARDDGRIGLLGADGKPPIGESDAASRRLGDAAHPDGRVQQVFDIAGGQAIYGLGQHQAGLLNYRGTSVRLQQANTDVGVPVLVSTAGYGVFWNNAAVTDVAVAMPQATDRIVWRSQDGSGVDYFLFGGPTSTR
ncbi:hypothetical protein AB5I41_27745 [Sphingomonas sp. MMS24-JH45]